MEVNVNDSVKLLNDTPVTIFNYCRAVFEDNKAEKEIMDNPIFEVFYLADAQVLLLIMDNHQKNIHYNIYF